MNERMSLDEVLAELQNAVNENTGHRKLLLEKVMTACKELKLSPDEDSGARTEAKIAIIKLAEDLMTSTEGGINKSVTAELRRSTIDIEKERSSAYVEALKNIGYHPIVPGGETNLDDSSLDKAFNDGEFEEIKEGESEM
jgi:hypothetical protein